MTSTPELPYAIVNRSRVEATIYATATGWCYRLSSGHTVPYANFRSYDDAITEARAHLRRIDAAVTG